MLKINLRRVAWGLLAIASLSFVILLVITNDIVQNHREEFPWYMTPFILITIISCISFFAILVIPSLIKKIRRMKF